MIAAAVLAAQKEMPAIHKDSKADTGKFSYTYLSLQKLLETVVPVLNKHGLALLQAPAIDDISGRQILYTRLVHESGEEIEFASPLIVTGNETPQAWGGAVTYARRYALTALLGIAADEDDDGRQASTSSPKPKAKTASAAQIARLHAIMAELAKQRGVDPEQPRSALKAALNIDTLKDLSIENAKKADEILASWQSAAARERTKAIA